MPETRVVLYTLLAYGAALIAVGVWASRRNRDNTDFFLGGRRLGAWVAALSASASSSSAWTLLGVSGAAYVWGLSALWLFPATVGGFLINWFFVAPRLRRIAREEGALTLTEFVAPTDLGHRRAAVLRLATAIVVFSFMFYVASQFDGAGKAFQVYFGWPREWSILAGVAIVLVYTFLGGFWAVSVSDALQGLLMVAAALLLPLVAAIAMGGADQLLPALRATASADQLSPTGAYGGALGLAFVLGTLGIGLGYPGQPHVLNRFMALRDERALRRGRLIAVGWAVVIYSGMLFVGLAARVLYSGIGDGETVLFELAGRALPPVISGMLLAAVLSAIMSTADSQLLVAASSVSHDWRLARGAPAGSGIARSRIVVLVLSFAAAALAIFVEEAIFDRVLFAWHAIGSAFAPLVVARVCGCRVGGGATLAVLATGFGLTVAFHWLPDTPGDWLERLVPLAAAATIAWIGCRKAGGAPGTP